MELKIRAVSEADAEELVEIYRYYVEHTAITYECHVPSVEEFRQRIRHTLEKYPYLVAELDGKIVGVIAQSFSGEADTGVVTALSISDLRKLIEQLSNNEDLIYLGVRGQDISSSLSQKTGIPTGIYVNSVEEDSPAMNAGIQNGDVIVKVGNESVETLSRLRTRLDQSKKDQKIKVTAMRKGAEGYVEIVFDVTLDAL